MAETNGILDNLDSTLSIAYRSICNAKTPIKTLNDLCQIKFDYVCAMLGARGRKKAKEPKRYIPQKNSAAYAFLITLYREMQNGASYMNKQELIDASEASGLSRTSIALDKSKQPGSLGSSRDWYTGWSCMKTLMSRGLVLKSSCPAKFMLTQEGKEAAHECLIRSGNLQSMSESNRCHCISDAQRSFVVKLTSQPATASCQQKVIDIGKQADLSDLNVDYAIQRKQSISTFISSPIVEVYLYLNSLVGSTDIMTTISAADMKSQIPVRCLPVGDGIWLARGRGCNTEYVLDFIVERKRVDDLCKSIWDNKYRDQKLRLQRCGLQKLIYLVEGDVNSLEVAESIKTAYVYCYFHFMLFSICIFCAQHLLYQFN
ncbi:crossover junction endonuclease MUS81-like [Zingiber officinale]|uniref:crossover junction endonuclease MUS81-like n=1 Tax=Zingiber officinale TaxID=94328 RepID=UPI001C4CE1E0|nr:crossover junction endonuclease MUS81-like [Zingiber officinale]